ncbi:MAG: DUF4430 domain-containing protein [Candidatus Gottesmanbacteria bacterium]
MNKKRLIALIIFIIGLGLIAFSLYPEVKKKNNSQVSGVQIKEEPSAKPKNSPSISAVVTSSLVVQISSPNPTPLVESSNVPANSNSPSPEASPMANPPPASQPLQINLSINGGSSFTVNIDQGNNQCDVLTKAKEQGKIDSLNMQFNNSLGSFAVYQINGIGKENSVWWTYTINSVSPAQGCSYIKANNGDKIEWKYLGS